jgi:hypothetical protein
MVVRPEVLVTKNDYVGEDHQQFTRQFLMGFKMPPHRLTQTAAFYRRFEYLSLRIYK